MDTPTTGDESPAQVVSAQVASAKVEPAEAEVMYIFVNCTLGLTKGQVVAQCCHITYVITDERVTALYEEHPPTTETLAYMRWRKNCTKVILRATSAQLHELSLLPYARRFTDEGYRMPKGSMTVVGFLPMLPSNVDLDMNEYRLL
jgi:peptidyl-tRNA hydrolase